MTALLDKMDFIILPVLNVDGYAYTWIDPVGHDSVLKKILSSLSCMVLLLLVGGATTRVLQIIPSGRTGNIMNPLLRFTLPLALYPGK